MMNIFTPTLPRGERKHVTYNDIDTKIEITRPFGLNYDARRDKPRPRRAKKETR